MSSINFCCKTIGFELSPAPRDHRVSILATLVSLYALSAILYGTVTGMITINRLAMSGCNVINFALLVLILIRLLRRSAQPWNERIKTVFSLGAVFYVSWSLFVILVLPLIFR